MKNTGCVGTSVLLAGCSKTLSFFSSHGQRVVLNVSQRSVCSSHWRSFVIRRSLLNSASVSCGYGWVGWHSGLYRLIGSCLMFCLTGVLLFWCSVCLCSTCFMFCLIDVLLCRCSVWCSACLVFFFFDVLLDWCSTCLMFCLFGVLLVCCSAWLVFYLFDVLLDWCSTCLMFCLFDVLLVWCSTWLVFCLFDVLLDWWSTCLMSCLMGVLLVWCSAGLACCLLVFQPPAGVIESLWWCSHFNEACPFSPSFRAYHSVAATGATSKPAFPTAMGWQSLAVTSFGLTRTQRT